MRKIAIEKIRIKSFVTTLDFQESLTIKGGDTEDNTDVQASLYWCNTQNKPKHGSNFQKICINPY